ncbi:MULTISPECIES: hypothetical protein [Acidianus]|nr:MULTISPECIES: hypothetical protein [Acidianus]NON62338.1 hypothetical protein [Acidianus sp. RZ1]
MIDEEWEEVKLVNPATTLELIHVVVTWKNEIPLSQRTFVCKRCCYNA